MASEIPFTKILGWSATIILTILIIVKNCG